MSEAGNDKTYIGMMEDALKKKKTVLVSIYNQTKEQEMLLADGAMDVDRFEMLLEEKGQRIDELNRIDEGFDSLYKKLEQELLTNRGAYQEEISRMKVLIQEVTDLGTKIQVLEKRNHDRFQSYIADERAKLREATKTQQTVQTYAQNMAGAHKPGNSYFFNETK